MLTFSQAVTTGIQIYKRMKARRSAADFDNYSSYALAVTVAKKVLEADGTPEPAAGLWEPLAEYIYQQGDLND